MDSSATFEHRHPCEAFDKSVRSCHRRFGKLGEECVREELAQKKCYARLLCRNEANRFYHEQKIPQNYSAINGKWKTFLNSNDSNDGTNNRHGKVSCATLVEVFAMPENELLIPEGIQKSDRVYCREITHALATCLSKKHRPSMTS